MPIHQIILMIVPKNAIIISDIQILLDQISQTQITNTTLEKNTVENKIQIVESLINKNPVNIEHFKNILIPVRIKEKCIICQRNAEYMNITLEKEKYCWIHSQNLN